MASPRRQAAPAGEREVMLRRVQASSGTPPLALLDTEAEDAFVSSEAWGTSELSTISGGSNWYRDNLTLVNIGAAPPIPSA